MKIAARQHSGNEDISVNKIISNVTFSLMRFIKFAFVSFYDNFTGRLFKILFKVD